MKRQRLTPPHGSAGPRRTIAAVAFSLASVQLAACGGDGLAGPSASVGECSTALSQFVDGGPDRFLIPALMNPKVAHRGTPDVAYVKFSELVIGLEFNGQWLAVPLKLLWYHEVINFEVPGERLTVTYSPLTGSAMVFDPAPTGVGDFEVSKYLLDTNLVMKDSTGTLWPQMQRTASCGAFDGASLARVPHQIMTWGAWFSIHLDTWAVSSGTGFDFLYTLYPYGDYRDPNNPRLLYPIAGSMDTRRPPKELILGVPAGDGGVAFSIPVMAQLARDDQGGRFPVSVWAANAMAGDEPVVAFWNSVVGGAMAYRAVVNGQPLMFEVVEGTRRDVETGSIWDFDGNALSGPLQGESMVPMADAFIAYWFAWAQFQPNTEMWPPPSIASVVPDPDILLPTTSELVDASLYRR